MGRFKLKTCLNVNTDGMDYTPSKISTFEHFSSIYVVAAHAEGPCKIGISSNLPQRIRALQSGNWEELKIYGFRLALEKSKSEFEASLKQNLERGAKRLEKTVHSKMLELGLTLRGEWADISASDALAVIDKCGALGSVASLSLEAVSGAPISANLDAQVAKTQKELVSGMIKITGMMQNSHGLSDGTVDLGD